MPTWIDVADEAEVSKACRQSVRAGDCEVAVFRVDGRWCVIENACPHAGLPLEGGDLTGTILTCPFHGYTFDIATGRNIDDPTDGGVRTFPVKVENGRVFVDIERPAQ